MSRCAAADADRPGAGGERGADGAVARQVLAQPVGDGDAVDPAGRHGVGRVEEPRDPEALTPGGRRGVHRALGHLDDGVGPRHLGVAVVEQRVAGLGERGVDDAAVVGVEDALEAVPTVVVEVGLERLLVLRDRLRRRRTGGPHHDPQLGDGGQRGDLGEVVVEVGRGLGGDGRLVDRQRPVGEHGHRGRVGGAGLGQPDDVVRPRRRDAALPRQPVGQRPDAGAVPRPGRRRLGRQLDQLGVQDVELSAHLPQPILDGGGGCGRDDLPGIDAIAVHPSIVHQFVCRMQHLFDRTATSYSVVIRPPSMTKSAPVTLPARSLASSTTRSATSSGR